MLEILLILLLSMSGFFHLAQGKLGSETVQERKQHFQTILAILVLASLAVLVHDWIFLASCPCKT